jgi:rhodanese-related sulfurtransferase
MHSFATAPYRRLFFIAALLIFIHVHPGFAQNEHIPASSIPTADLIQPADLAASLQSASPKPLILQVGSHILFAEAHIPGAEYAGPTNQDAGLQILKDRVALLPKDTAIVLYCGCCPWDRCPNIAPAWNLLHTMGFTNLKVLYIADNFGSNWVAKGYPVAKGRS